MNVGLSDEYLGSGNAGSCECFCLSRGSLAKLLKYG